MGAGSYHGKGDEKGDEKGGGRQWSAAEKDQFVKDKRKAAAELDKRFGYELLEEGPPRLGWLFNMVPTAVEEGGVELAAVDLYFLEQGASTCPIIFNTSKASLLAKRWQNGASCDGGLRVKGPR